MKPALLILAAGIFDLLDGRAAEQGLQLIATRARLMQQLPQDGSMAVIFASQEKVRERLQPYLAQVSIAAVNGPENTVISGSSQAVQAALAEFAAQDIPVQMMAGRSRRAISRTRGISATRRSPSTAAGTPSIATSEAGRTPGSSSAAPSTAA